MTGYSTIPGTSEAADFVMISYSGADYLVNREEVVSSLYLGGGARQGGDSPIQALDYNNRIIPLISLDDHLIRHFGETPSRESGVILFIQGKGGPSPFPRIRRKSDGGAVDTSIIAVRASGMAGMLSVPLSELKLLPRGVRKGISKYGLLAVRFPDPGGRIQYFIDMRTVIIMSIIHLHNRQALNENTDR
jgi:hypothetical protein